MSTMMTCTCPRCGKILSCLYGERYLRICDRCLNDGYLVHTVLIPKGFIDPEDVATIREQYLTRDEYLERLKSEQGTEATGNIPTVEEQRT